MQAEGEADVDEGMRAAAVFGGFDDRAHRQQVPLWWIDVVVSDDGTGVGFDVDFALIVCPRGELKCIIEFHEPSPNCR